MTGKREFGDYQTPVSFAQEVCAFLKRQKNVSPKAIIEPTCGIGNFLEASLSFNADCYWGIDINPDYCEQCQQRITDSRVHIINEDFFTFDYKKILHSLSDTLVIGNPPWITNSDLSASGSPNLPAKANFKGLKGIDAITGASNFDICEYMILRLIHEFQNTNTTIAMLCKTSVARNIFKELKRNEIFFDYCEVLEFDAVRVFGVNASACLLLIKLSSKQISADNCNVYSFENYPMPRYSFGFRNEQFYSNLQAKCSNFEGNSCFEWRQGVKHDCAKVMELSMKDGAYFNGQNEPVDIEDKIVFPLVKSSMFKQPIINAFSRYVIVTQKKARDDTACIQEIAPKTWKYLNAHAEAFNKRKSSIYDGAPLFSMFGVGDYSYAKYKVGISGFYKKPLFAILYDNNGKPVMTDDTSYFIYFSSYDMAYVAMLLLNSAPVQSFLMSIAFWDAKRPYTKKVLERLSFQKMVGKIDLSDLKKTEAALGIEPYVTGKMYSTFKALPELQLSEQLKFPLIG